MHDLLISAFHGFTDYVWRIFYVSMFCLALELVLPANRVSLKSRLRGAYFWVAYIAIRTAFYTVFLALWGKLGFKPLFHIDFSPFTGASNPVEQILWWIAVPIIITATGDFFYYWFHRLQHSSAFMWRFHEVHHSLREMSAWNSNHHWTEEILRIPLVVIPMGLMFSFDSGAVPVIIFTILGAQGQFEHSATRINLGWFRYIIADNRFHRIHHSVEQEHHNKNFGSFSSIWDVVFRTARFPRKGEWPAVGLDHVDEPKTLREFLLMPFVRRRDSAARQSAPDAAG